jgi:ligand-binding SRPBCC domain-containing protein
VGPYKFWHHRHQFVSSDNGVDIVDDIHYAIGFSFFGDIVHSVWVKRQLVYIFRYRREKVVSLIASRNGL